MVFHKIYLMLAIAFIPECRGLCSKPELMNVIPQGSSLGIGHTFKTFPTQSVLVCMELCISYPMCRSIDLNHEKRVCRLQVKSSVTDPDLLVATPNTVHMDKEDFPKILLDNACQTLSCDNMTMCKGNTGCVPVLDDRSCGSPPSVSNATASPAGPFPVGHTHNYTCHVDYDALHEPYTTCQENGKWTDVVFLCQRTSPKYKLSGCYEDSRYRVLESGPHSLQINGQSQCASHCATLGSYSYFGLESGHECFCGNGMRYTPKQVATTQCNFQCRRNSEEICGGHWKIQIFSS
uniref:Fungistatic metabolite n=1 Tax=Crassostrea virginica TaxID=6565 RepID=A0A8B8CAE6_CRAVI|nr:putative fungistatic metabolite [Crassostrea virginica]